MNILPIYNTYAYYKFRIALILCHNFFLAMPLSKCSRSVVFINTSHPDKRVAVTKSKEELKKLPPDSTEIFTKSQLDHYVVRPVELENFTLADFAAKCSYSKEDKEQRKAQYEDDDSDRETEVTKKWLPLTDGSGFVRLMKRCKIIRYVRYGPKCVISYYIRR